VGAFIADGGWSFLHDSKGTEEEGDEQSVNSDSNFEEEKEEGSYSGEESDYGDEESDA
jgi:hypothetical protein